MRWGDRLPSHGQHCHHCRRDHGHRFFHGRLGHVHHCHHGRNLGGFVPKQAFITELEWFSHIQALVDGDGQVPLESFIVSPALYLNDDFIAAWAQFVWQVATRLEVQVSQDDWVRTEEPEMSTDWSIRAVDRTCMLHRASC